MGRSSVKIDAALSGVKLLYMDTSPFIYFTEKRPIYVDKMHKIFRYMADGQLDVITSTIALSECLTKPLKNQDTALATAYSNLFESTNGLSLTPVDSIVARLCADLRARYGLKTPDGLHIATALVTQCNAFLTNDLGLKRVSEIRILMLDELDI